MKPVILSILIILSTNLVGMEQEEDVSADEVGYQYAVQEIINIEVVTKENRTPPPRKRKVPKIYRKERPTCKQRLLCKFNNTELHDPLNAARSEAPASTSSNGISSLLELKKE
jgi:hypothetical protein